MARKKAKPKRKPSNHRAKRVRLYVRSKTARRTRTRPTQWPSEAHEQTLLSEERTLLSKERTILQEMTVFLALIALGFGVIKIFETNAVLVSVGSFVVVLGVVLVFASLYSYHQYSAKVKELEHENHLADGED